MKIFSAEKRPSPDKDTPFDIPDDETIYEIDLDLTFSYHACTIESDRKLHKIDDKGSL